MDHVLAGMGKIAALMLIAVLLPNAAMAETVSKSTSPITAKELAGMKRGVVPGFAGFHGLRPETGSALARVILPKIQKLQAEKPAAGSTPDLTSASRLMNFGLFYTAPYVSGWPSGDSSPVYTSAAADFDGKRGPDVATVQFDGTLNVLFNNGQGKFATTYSNSSATALDPGIVYIQQADLNGDGYPDIVAMDGTNSAFLIFLNQKDGTFADAVSTSVTPASGASFGNGGGIVIADVNGDGKNDVITVANLQLGQFPNYTTVFSEQTFLGNGNGTFQPPSGTDSTLTGYFYVQYGAGLALADTNADGKLDLVMEVAENDSSFATLIDISTGDGAGNFAQISGTAAQVETAESPQATLQVSDLNHDGNPDVLFITFDGSIYAAMGNGEGTLDPPSAVLPDLIGASMLSLGDFDADGKLDLVVYGYGQVGIFHGNDDGTFAPAALGQYAGSLGGDQQADPADFNRDGKLDFVWTESVYGKVSTFINRGNGTFIATAAIVPANASSDFPNNTEWGYNNLTAAVGDFNHDGLTDVLTYDFTTAADSGFADIDFGLSDGKGHFQYTQAMPGNLVGANGIISALPVTGDFNGDGRDDVMFSTNDGLIIALANADGTLQTPITATFPVPVGCDPVNYVDFGDVNHDGHLDFVAGYAQNPNCRQSKDTPSGYFVFLGDGTGHFTGTFTALGGALYFVKLIDFNGDGNLDIGIADLDAVNNQYNFYVVPGNGDGTFNTSAAKTQVTSAIVSGIVPGDFNNDGKQDLTLLTAGEFDGSGGLIAGTQGALQFPGNGDFTFGSSQLLAKGIYALTGAYADFNGDGKMDLAISQYASFQDTIRNFGLIVLPGLGGGNFGPASNFLLPQFSGVGNSSVFTGDFNGDAATDVVVGGSSALFLNRR